jgi:hypothetical protein
MPHQNCYATRTFPNLFCFVLLKRRQSYIILRQMLGWQVASSWCPDQNPVTKITSHERRDTLLWNASSRRIYSDLQWFIVNSALIGVLASQHKDVVNYCSYYVNATLLNPDELLISEVWTINFQMNSRNDDVLVFFGNWPNYKRKL